MGPNSDHIYHTDEVAAELGYHSQGGNALDQSLPSGKRLHNYGKSQCLMGNLTISMAIIKFANCKRLPGRVFWLIECWEKNLTQRYPEWPKGFSFGWVV